ncbi:LisH [Gregarina niphandrodes]|uniref:LisH n=1 Tax=Gregarina niphandrodes TaxID=110365 RepID=A0A023AZZ7_GRENI|nr:LisH [Gregarina niphandrodes]EZG44716.1 LisH [Gregarina niphandrodes]|eukprot:XP_011134136.1 LisH [Gregarina niphandrodes]
MKVTIKAEELNYAIYRHLLENGYHHSAYLFQQEAQIPNTLTQGQIPQAQDTGLARKGKTINNFPPHCLITLIHKALLYLWVEYHTDAVTGELNTCESSFSLFKPHVCRKVAAAGKKAVKKAPPGRGRRAAKEEFSLDTSAGLTVLKGGDIVMHADPPDAQSQATFPCLAPDHKHVLVWWANDANRTGDCALYTLEGEPVDLPSTAKQLLGVRVLQWTAPSAFKITIAGRRADVTLDFRDIDGTWQQS